LARLRANGNGEAMRLRTLAEQERAINEVRALRTAGKPRTVGSRAITRITPMEKGQLCLVDGKPAEFCEYYEDMDGDYVTYRHLKDPPGVTHWLSLNGAAVRMHLPKHRS
jgi:hypothetical protein